MYTHTHTYIHKYVCVCVCVCGVWGVWGKDTINQKSKDIYNVKYIYFK